MGVLKTENNYNLHAKDYFLIIENSTNSDKY